MSAWRQLGIAVAVAAAACTVLSCTGPHLATPKPTRPSHGDNQDDRGPRPALVLQVAPAPYQLPSGVSREVVLPGATGLLIVGGLTRLGASASTVTSLDPVTGATRAAGRLAQATHDAAGLLLGGRAFVLGGGTASSVPTIQALVPGAQAAVTGALSQARSDSNGVSAGAVGYVIGGYDGTRWNPQVLATRDGQHFRVAARLAVPVRYAAVAVVGGRIWVFGGQTAAGPTNVIQRIDAATGAAAVAGHLPRAVQGATVIGLQGRIYVAGGVTAQGTSATVYRFDPDDAFFSPDGRYIIATQEDDQVISVISVADSRITYRFGVPGTPGSGPDHLFNPDDAMLTPAGVIVSADIKNCRLVIITPPAHTVTRVIGRTTNACQHDPPRRFGSPNGAFPMSNGDYLITEINNDWVDAMSLNGTRPVVSVTARDRLPVGQQPGRTGSLPDRRLHQSRQDRGIIRVAARCSGDIGRVRRVPCSTTRRSPSRYRTGTFSSTTTTTTACAW